MSDEATATAPKKKAPPNPLRTAERSIAKAIKLAEEGRGTDAQKALFTKGLRGVERLLQTLDRIANPDNPPGPDSAWGKVVALAEEQDSVAEILAPVPADAF